MSPRIRALAILHDVDAGLDGYTCDASTECCRFAVTGREPQVTEVEWRLVVDEVARQGRRLPAVPADDDGRCPFLSPLEGQPRHIGGKCMVYAARPLGCRTFFCDRARDADGTPGAPSSSTRELREAARDLEGMRATDDARARPLRSWLRSESKRKPR